MPCRSRSRWSHHWLIPTSSGSTPSSANHRFAGDRALAEQDARSGTRGQIDVDPAAEADQADALAGLDLVAFANERQDAARDEPGDLGEADPDPVRALDEEMLALIVLAGLVEVGIEELARDIGDPCARARRSASG